ncbi:MAG: glycine betaine ABC transporter substrate-binding protein [Desulfobulbaceae bacterium]|nr:glycine betaine ABC transporter substrate-binding protein [Desulfobulbaceae bacterium]
MYRTFCILFTAFLLATGVNSFACVGKTLVIGALDAPNERLLAQMMAVIITERTGTTVNVVHFDDQQKLYEAVAREEVNLLTENTSRALQMLGREAGSDADNDYSLVKEEFESRYQLILLKPFGKSPALTDMDVPIVAASILIEYPALPRVLNKLAGITREKNYADVLASVASGSKPNQAARDFLKKKRFI